MPITKARSISRIKNSTHNRRQGSKRETPVRKVSPKPRSANGERLRYLSAIKNDGSGWEPINFYVLRLSDLRFMDLPVTIYLRVPRLRMVYIFISKERKVLNETSYMGLSKFRLLFYNHQYKK